MTNMVDIAWTAGILEGEGSFVRRSRYSCAVSCQMTDKDILDRLQVIFGGSVYVVRKRMPHWKDCWVWRLNGQPAIDCMQKILPHMGVRRSERINELLVRWKNQADIKAQREERNESIVSDYQAGGFTMRQLAVKYGVDRQTVCNAIHMVS